jgi:ankyrin repeat protein
VGRESDRAAHQGECVVVRLCARFDVEREATSQALDVEREATSQATARVMDALLDTTTSAQAGKNKALCLGVAHDNLAPLAGRLIAGGAEVDAARPGDGYTPLCIACKHGNLVTVERLIAAGGRVDNASTAGSTPLFITARNNRLDVLKLLIAAGADVNLACDDGCTPLHKAAQMGHAGVVSLLIETAGVELNAALRDDEDAGVTPLYVAAQENRLDVVTLLIAAGADVNKACVVDDCSPLHMAAQNGHAGVVDLILAAGANVHATCTDGTTALSVALAQGHAEVAQKLRAATVSELVGCCTRCIQLTHSL